MRIPASAAEFRYILAIGLAAFVMAFLIDGQPLGVQMARAEEPRYQVVESSGDIEVRRYAPQIVAQVETRGEREQAINEGFRILAGFIFGDNTSARKIEMTAPVTQQPGETIDMTAPVTQQRAQAADSGPSWHVRFIMPADYTIDTLPKPRNPRIAIIALPERQVAAIRFSGFTTQSNISTHRERLVHFLRERRLTTAGEPVYAFYDPPWTLPFFRRNEVMAEIVP